MERTPEQSQETLPGSISWVDRRVIKDEVSVAEPSLWQRQPSDRIRIRSITGAMLTMLVVAIPFLYRYQSVGVSHMSWVLGVVVAGAVLNLWLVRRINPMVSGYFACALLYGLLLTSNITSGGFYNPNFGWLYVVPLAGAILANLRAAVFLTVLVALTALGFWLLPYLGIDLPDRIPRSEQALQALFNRLSAIVAVGLLTWLFVRQQRDAEDDLKTASDDLEREAARVDELAYFDMLTGLPNRRHFLLKLQQSQTQNTEAALLCFSLDHFKDINDTLGPATGDKVLQEVAGRLRHTLELRRNSGRILARIGGDEFALFVPGLREQSAISIVESLLEEMRHAIQLPGREVVITASAGIAFANPKRAVPPDELLMQADAAMHAAKRERGNTYKVFAKQMKTEHERRVIMGGKLRRALRSGEGLRLVYQPIFDASTEQIVGVEALLRWQDEDTHVSPGEFVPVAEAIGLAPQLDAWVIRRALNEIKRVHDLGHATLRIAINISAAHVRDPEIVEHVRNVLIEAGVAAKYVELEMTESALVSSDPIVGRNIAKLSELGVGIVLDDFGTGYSSLSHLRDFPVTKLKIDRSFVEDVAENSAGAKLCHAVTALGLGMGLDVVAEGIETPGQQDALVTMGCTHLQGFLLARPITTNELLERLEAQTTVPTHS